MSYRIDSCNSVLFDSVSIISSFLNSHLFVGTYQRSLICLFSLRKIIPFSFAELFMQESDFPCCFSASIRKRSEWKRTDLYISCGKLDISCLLSESLFNSYGFSFATCEVTVTFRVFFTTTCSTLSSLLAS